MHKNNSFVKESVKDFAEWPDHPLFEVKIPAQDGLTISAPHLLQRESEQLEIMNMNKEILYNYDRVFTSGITEGFE